RRTRQQQHELLAAVARQHALRTDAFAQLDTEMTQGAVTGLVAQFVVEALEVVDVDHGERQRALAQPGLPLESRELALEPAPVEGAGQLVDQHLAAGVGKASLEFGDPFPQLLGPAARALEALPGRADLATHGARLP